MQPVQAGDILFEVGDLSYDMIVILSGGTRILERTGGEDRVLKESGPGEFHAELGLLTGQTVFVACEVREAGDVLLIPASKVREAIRTIPQMSDVLVMAFAARRQVLMRSAAATLTFIGNSVRHNGLRMKEFANRNRIPYRWLDISDPAAHALLGDHDFSDTTIPRAVIRGHQVLDDPTPVRPG